MKVAVIVPVHNGGVPFRRCLEHLGKTEPSPDELIVVVDGSDEGDAKLAESFGARVKRLSKTAGPAAARNAGAELATGDILFFVDADVALPVEAVQLVREAFQADPGLAALFGSYDDAPAESNFLSQVKNLQHHYVHQTGETRSFSFWTGCGAIRRPVFSEEGGFDIDSGVEDIELGYRVTLSGRRIHLLKSLQATHLKRWTFWQLLRTDFFRRALPWTDLILSSSGLPDDLNLRSSARVSVILAVALPLLLPLTFFWFPFLIGAPLCILGLAVLNFDFYRFLFRKRGLSFSLKAFAWHWFYYLYSGVAFAVGVVRHWVRGLGKRIW